MPSVKKLTNKTQTDAQFNFTCKNLTQFIKNLKMHRRHTKKDHWETLHIQELIRKSKELKRLLENSPSREEDIRLLTEIIKNAKALIAYSHTTRAKIKYRSSLIKIEQKYREYISAKFPVQKKQHSAILLGWKLIAIALIGVGMIGVGLGVKIKLTGFSSAAKPHNR